jgi:hypothetical protein
MSTPTRGGRRIAAAPRRFRGDRSTVVAVVLVLLAAVAVLLTRNPAPADLAGESAGAVVDRTLLGCPEDTTARLRSRTDIGLAPVEGPAGALGEGGTLKVGPVGQGADTPLRRGTTRTVDSAPAPVLDATGAVAAGLFGFRADQLGRATAVGACVAPRADWWFTGPGAGLDHLSDLVMTNIDPGPAVVDIRVYGADGEVETVGTRGMTVAPGETRRVALADVAPQNDEVVVQVEASRGRVAAAITDHFAPRAGGPAGLEWVSAMEKPDRSLRLAGVPAKATARTLLVGNPSDSEALVDLEVSGSRGSFVPSGFETLSVPPGAVRSVDVTDLFAGKEATSVRVKAQVPVVASVRSVVGSDTSYSSTVTPLDDPAVVPVLAGTQTTVQLSAGAGGATARVSGYASSGKPTGEDEVTVDPASTTTWQPKKGTAYVVVTPLTGNVYGAATYAGTAGVATAPLTALPVRLDLPVVVPAPR